ncbi:MAG: GNAT family N-acetyltransferase [Pseudomonadota bacterium]
MKPGTNDMPRFRVIDFASAQYRATLSLRQQVLREPLGLVLSAQDLDGEERQWHFGLFDDADRLIACLVAAPADASSVRLRQMAVIPGMQGRGLGQALMCQTENHLRQRGIGQCTLHARIRAIGFYEKLGYSTTGPVFTELGIPHRRMIKTMSLKPAR